MVEVIVIRKTIEKTGELEKRTLRAGTAAEQRKGVKSRRLNQVNVVTTDLDLANTDLRWSNFFLCFSFLRFVFLCFSFLCFGGRFRCLLLVCPCCLGRGSRLRLLCLAGLSVAWFRWLGWPVLSEGRNRQYKQQQKATEPNRRAHNKTHWRIRFQKKAERLTSLVSRESRIENWNCVLMENGQNKRCLRAQEKPKCPW